MLKSPLSFLIICLCFLSFLSTALCAEPITETPITPANIFFLDCAKGEDAKLLEELATLTPTAETNLNLGWLHLLYKNDAPKAKEFFQKALVIDANNLEALRGLGQCYWWLGEDELRLANDIKRIKIDPNAPWLELVLDDLGGSGGGRICPNCGRVHDSESGSTVGLNSKQYLQLLEELLAKPLTNKFNETIIRERLFNARMALSSVSEELFRFWKTLGYPDKWLVIGYFKGSGEAAIDETFPPEREINPDAKYPVDDWDVKWHKRIATISNFDYFQSTLDDPIENRGDCIYQLTYINAPDERSAAFHLNNSQAYKIWLNDQLIAFSDPDNNYLPTYQVYGGLLQKGANKLLLKSRYPMEIQVTDLAGAPLTDLVYEIGVTTEAQRTQRPTAVVKAVRGNHDCYLEVLKDPGRKTLSHYITQASFYERDGLTQESFALWEELYNAHKSSAGANYLMAYAYENNRYLPQEKAKNLARACYKEAEKLADNLIPVKLGLADYYAEKNKEKAIEILQKTLETNPRCISAREKLRQMFSSRQWPAEAFGELQQLVKLMPDNVGLIFQMASHYYSQQNYAKSLEYYKRAYDLNGNKYRWSEIGINATLTNNQQPYLDIYQEMLKVQPDNPRYYRATASIYYTLKDYARVEELYHKVLSMAESDKERYEMYDDFARLYDDWNKPDKEREYRQKLNALPAKYQRYQDGTRRYYDFKDGKNEVWPEEVTVPVLELVKSAPGEKEYPQAGSIILFEQHLVRVSGTDTANLRTKETKVHEVIKLLNKQAGEQYGDLYKYGEIEEARVYKPISAEGNTATEFRVLEPDPIQEGWGGVRLPELDKGSVIELKYIKREPFYYREPGEIIQIDDSPMFRREKQPVLHLRYVVSLPKSIKYKCPPKYQNLTPELKDDGQTVTYIWDLKNTPDYDDEVMMPSEREVLPWADIYAGNLSFDKKLREYRSRYLKGRVPYNVRAKAAELTKDISDVAGKVRALYKFAVSEIKGGYGGYGSSDDTSLSHTLIEKEGSASGLMMGFLKALNIEAYWALPKARFTPGIDPDKEGPRINDYMPLIYIPDNNLWLAPGQFVPFGSIPVEMQGGDGYVIMPDGVKALELPLAPFAERCANALNLEIKILPDGSAEVKGALEMAGEAGAQWRTYLREYSTKQQKKQLVESIVGSLFPGAKLKKHEIPKFNVDEKITPINFTCTVPQFARRSDSGVPTQSGKTATGLEFKTVMKPMELTQYFLRETERKFPLRLHHYAKALSAYDRIKIILPDVTSADLPESKLIASDYGCYSRWVKADGNVVSIERKFTLEEQDIPPQYYPAFSDFCKKIEQIEQEQVKLVIK